ncbi:uncharacterized protein BJ212DRAFT_1500051 [Suillus subaureus]|uniref:Uncharacterized protein n=1 Tax=Suillus subaureus TaxID=48587 RepID=A0A9P7EC94_9AGAM|nr:uncharacterized protein BJ212DRAFT_1500051 [Suillus subaureus]KAG1817570.1 hypothetical protein BJ212DRAFT_1500051 [Suillus subaureus]
MFVGYAITPTSSTNISRGDNAMMDLISLLVDLATIEGDSNVSDIVSVPQQTTSKVMNAIRAADFLIGALIMLQSDETRIKAGALEILADRILKAAEAVIANNRRLLHQLLTTLGMSQHCVTVLCMCGFSSLAFHVTEEFLTPYFQEIAQECTSVLQEGLSGNMAVDCSAQIVQSSGLVLMLPTFYGAAEIRDIVKLHLDYSVTLSGSMTVLIDSFGMNMKSMTAPVMCQGEPHIISAFLELVVKLNETAFRLLFCHLYDCVFAAENANIELTFCHMYSALLDYFKVH